MTRSLLSRALVIGSLAATHVAVADPRHVLVLKPEGSADAATKSKIDAQIVKLAKNLDGNIEAGEITFTDAAAAVGCSGNEAQCKDDVLSTMGVDEVVSINVMAMPSGDLRVVVHRVPKGGSIKDGQTTVPAGQAADAKLAADLGPLFGAKAAKPAAGAAAGGAAAGGVAAGGAATGGATKPAGGATTGGATAGGATGTTTTSSSGGFGDPPPTKPAGGTATTASTSTPGGVATAPAGGTATTAATTTTHAATPTRTAQAEPTNNNVTAAPNGQVTTTPTTEGRSSNRALAGMVIGGGLVALGLVMWAEASSTQGDINSAPTRSPADFKNLQDLESKADTYAGLGNLFFIGGVVVGGVSGYFYWRGHRSGSSTQARLAPTLFDHGAGLALTVGGAP